MDFSIVSNSWREWKIDIFQFPLSYSVKLWVEPFKLGMSAGEGEPWLNYQLLRIEIFIFMLQICVSLSAGDTVSKLEWGWKLQSYTWSSDANFNKWEFKCNLLHLFILYIDTRTRYISNKTCSIYLWNQNRSKAENNRSSLQQRYLFIYLFIYIWL